MNVEMSGLGSSSEWFFYAFHPALSSLHVKALFEVIGSYLAERKDFLETFSWLESVGSHARYPLSTYSGKFQMIKGGGMKKLPLRCSS